jgi:hypothetical protein
LANLFNREELKVPKFERNSLIIRQMLPHRPPQALVPFVMTGRPCWRFLTAGYVGEHPPLRTVRTRLGRISNFSLWVPAIPETVLEVIGASVFHEEPQPRLKRIPPTPDELVEFQTSRGEGHLNDVLGLINGNTATQAGHEARMIVPDQISQYGLVASLRAD